MPCSRGFYLLLFLTFAMECWCRHHRHRTTPGCTRCGPGQAAIRPCDPLRLRDTQCATCPEGTYSPHHSYTRHCYLCARCGEGLYVAHHCTTTRDTVCDSCHTFKGPHNRDFISRCSPGLSSFAGHAGSGESVNQASHASQETWELPKSEETKARSYSTIGMVEVAPPPTRSQIVLVLVVSAVSSCALFAILAALAAYACHRAKSRKAHCGHLYLPVKTAEAVML